MKYRLVRREGVDTLHGHPIEECNLDDSENDVELEMTRDEAEAIVQGGSAHACGHCKPLEQEDA